MDVGRKIMNIRLDRRIRQIHLANAAGLSAGALSKIEVGVNHPRAKSLMPLARGLGVPTDYLVDPDQPYPYEPHGFEPPADGDDLVAAEVTRDEKHLLEHLRRKRGIARKVAHALPEMSIELLALVHRIVMHKRGVEISRRLREKFSSR